MPAVGITDRPPPCARDHQDVVLSRSYLARRWVVPECRSDWLVVGAQVKACSRETHSPSRASKAYGHNAFQLIHIHTTVINSGHAQSHTTQYRTHCGGALRLQSSLMPQSPHRLRKDLKCVEWDFKPCPIQSNPIHLDIRREKLPPLCKTSPKQTPRHFPNRIPCQKFQ